MNKEILGQIIDFAQDESNFFDAHYNVCIEDNPRYDEIVDAIESDIILFRKTLTNNGTDILETNQEIYYGWARALERNIAWN